MATEFSSMEVMGNLDYHTLGNQLKWEEKNFNEDSSVLSEFKEKH